MTTTPDPEPETHAARIARQRAEFLAAVRGAINYSGIDAEADTPDWILADFFGECLDAYREFGPINDTPGFILAAREAFVKCRQARQQFKTAASTAEI